MSERAQHLINCEKRDRTGCLDLGNCGLTELPDVSELDWLETLIVSNQWWDGSQNKWVYSQNTGGQPNHITTSPVHPLPSTLKKIILGSGPGKPWQIRDLRFLENLTALTSLDLSKNAISDLRFLENLTALTSLDLSKNAISDLRFLENLTALTSLRLGKNQIHDGRFLTSLTALSKLNLSKNQIGDGRFLESLTALTDLNLSKNQISDLQFLEKLTALTSLNLSHNSISNLRFLRNLTALTSLNLSHNSISDISIFQNFIELETLDIARNKIQDLSPALHLINKYIPVIWGSYKSESICVAGNPFNTPPVEVVKQGNKAILEYFQQKEKTGAKPLLEAKLILLGDGRAGKTSLASRLLKKALPTEADRTLGVDIVIGKYNFPVVEGYFKLNIWDFAGQDKYRPLHQFFYTQGAIYVMVADSGNSNTDFDDWFQIADLFGEGSPLVVVLNEFREGVGYGFFDEERWRKQFPKLLREVHLVNLSSEKGVPELERCIQYLAEKLPHVKVEYPNNWADIRSELERRRDENYISQQEFFKICRENDLPERESALVLSGILHTIGVCLHYQKSDLLRQHVILKNEWATQAVYQILEDKHVAETKKGFFDWDDLRRIWSSDEYSDMRPQLLELMQQFKMAYPLPNGKEFVTPPLLPNAPPEGWDLSGDDALEIFVEYKFLPKVLMTQFIVSRHADIDQERTFVWRNGVVLRWSADTVAEVKSFKSRGRDAFYIRSQGTERRSLLTAILKTLRELHANYSGIEFFEVVPCPCEGCQTQKNPQHFFDFTNLQNRLEKGRRLVECDKSLEEVDLVKLLGGLLVFENLAVGQKVVLGKTESPKSVEVSIKPAVPLAFFSYSKADIEYLKIFQKHLRQLERNGEIRLWDDLKIRPGEEWDNSIREALATADIIFLLLSPDFLATDYVAETEIAEAMRRHESGEARVIPIKLRPCSWAKTPFGKLQGLPRKDLIISTASDRDSAWLEVLREIEVLILR